MLITRGRCSIGIGNKQLRRILETQHQKLTYRCNSGILLAELAAAQCATIPSVACCASRAFSDEMLAVYSHGGAARFLVEKKILHETFYTTQYVRSLLQQFCPWHVIIIAIRVNSSLRHRRNICRLWFYACDCIYCKDCTIVGDAYLPSRIHGKGDASFSRKHIKGGLSLEGLFYSQNK